MGNQATKPYIVDEAESDDDISYDTAPENDLHPSDSDPDDLDTPPSNKGDHAVSKGAEKKTKGRKQMTVDAQVVSSLVANVEELLSHISNHDYQAAHSAAILLRSCGIGTSGLCFVLCGVEVNNLLNIVIVT